MQVQTGVMQQDIRFFTWTDGKQVCQKQMRLDGKKEIVQVIRIKDEECMEILKNSFEGWRLCRYHFKYSCKSTGFLHKRLLNVFLNVK